MNVLVYSDCPRPSECPTRALTCPQESSMTQQLKTNASHSKEPSAPSQHHHPYQSTVWLNSFTISLSILQHYLILKLSTAFSYLLNKCHPLRLLFKVFHTMAPSPILLHTLCFTKPRCSTFPNTNLSLTIGLGFCCPLCLEQLSLSASTKVLPTPQDLLKCHHFHEILVERAVSHFQKCHSNV